MEDELAIIFPGIIIMLIVIGLSVNGIVGKVLSHRREMREIERAGKATGSSQIDERTDMIEDRLRVLERLATDRGTLLADEIDALRDQPRDQPRGDVQIRREKENS